MNPRRREGREPGEADEDHDRAQPVLGPLPPRDQTAPDVGPADEQRDGRGQGDWSSLPLAYEHEQGRSNSRYESERRDQEVTLHQPTDQIVHPHPHGVQRQHASLAHGSSLAAA
jgi:hypothetical protein